MRIRNNVRINAYEVISRAVEEGIAYGYNRAYKHTSKPSEDIIKHEMENAVMNSLCEILKFDDDENDKCDDDNTEI
jgi:hypothetical protein